jgi:hypothetical protein
MAQGKWDISNKSIVLMWFWTSLIFSAAMTAFGLWLFESPLTLDFVIGFFALFGLMFLGGTFNTIAMVQLYKKFGMDVPDPPPKSDKADTGPK